MINFIDLAKAVIDGVRSRNEKNPDVKTADKSVFDNMEQKVEEISQKSQQNNNQGEVDIIEQMRRKMEEVKTENEVDPQVETADTSVFDDMQSEIDALKKKLEAREQASHQSDVNPGNQPQVDQIMAFTNSQGGSLALRSEPNIGASQNPVRIPDQTVIRVLGYSENSIMLDGRESKFVLVEYNGNKGWLLDSYLNFN